jgi:hypothetical protein
VAVPPLPGLELGVGAAEVGLAEETGLVEVGLTEEEALVEVGLAEETGLLDETGGEEPPTKVEPMAPTLMLLYWTLELG